MLCKDIEKILQSLLHLFFIARSLKVLSLISDVFIEIPFVNPAVIGLCNGEIMRFTS